MLGSTLGRRKVGETFPKSAGCTLEEQKRPKVLPKGFGASLKCIVPKFNECRDEARSGDPDKADKMCDLGFRYAHGMGCRKNYRKAHFWYEASYINGLMFGGVLSDLMMENLDDDTRKEDIAAEQTAPETIQEKTGDKTIHYAKVRSVHAQPYDTRQSFSF